MTDPYERTITDSEREEFLMDWEPLADEIAPVPPYRSRAMDEHDDVTGLADAVIEALFYDPQKDVVPADDELAQRPGCGNLRVGHVRTAVLEAGAAYRRVPQPGTEEWDARRRAAIKIVMQRFHTDNFPTPAMIDVVMHTTLGIEG